MSNPVWAEETFELIIKNGDFLGIIELVALLSNYLEMESQEFMKTDKEERH